jgi:hypothetical protein
MTYSSYDQRTLNDAFMKDSSSLDHLWSMIRKPAASPRDRLLLEAILVGGDDGVDFPFHVALLRHDETHVLGGLLDHRARITIALLAERIVYAPPIREAWADLAHHELVPLPLGHTQRASDIAPKHQVDLQHGSLHVIP